jgi:magnesium transporter
MQDQDLRETTRELAALLNQSDSEGIKDYLEHLTAQEIIFALSHLSKDEQVDLLHVLEPENAAGIIDDIPYVQGVDILNELDTSKAAAIIQELDSANQADILADLDASKAESIIAEFELPDAENLRQLITYEQDTAGGLMITEFLAFEEEQTVGQVVRELRQNVEKYEKYNVQYIYVLKSGIFRGVLRMRDLLLSKENALLTSILIKDVKTVDVDASIEELIDFFDTYDFYGVPVLDKEQRLIGVVLRKYVREEQSEQSQMELLETQGIVGGEELRTMPVLLRSRRRLSWLSVNILLNIVAASVIAFYQDTLSSVIALAVFLPVISDMSGCSGNQAVAVSLRELSLGVVKPFEILRVIVQEFWVGLINGIILGLLLIAVSFFWKGNVYLGFVAGGALAINTIVAVLLGGSLPLILKRFNVDPALASGPILTTVTDMFGFFLALTFASMLLPYLT